MTLFVFLVFFAQGSIRTTTGSWFAQVQLIREQRIAVSLYDVRRRTSNREFLPPVRNSRWRAGIFMCLRICWSRVRLRQVDRPTVNLVDEQPCCKWCCTQVHSSTLERPWHAQVCQRIRENRERNRENGLNTTGNKYSPAAPPILRFGYCSSTVNKSQLT